MASFLFSLALGVHLSSMSMELVCRRPARKIYDLTILIRHRVHPSTITKTFRIEQFTISTSSSFAMFYLYWTLVQRNKKQNYKNRQWYKIAWRFRWLSIVKILVWNLKENTIYISNGYIFEPFKNIKSSTLHGILDPCTYIQNFKSISWYLINL